MDETEEQLQAQIKILQCKILAIRKEKEKKKSDFQQFIGKYYKSGYLYAKILSVYSANNNVVTFEIMGIMRETNNNAISQKDFHTVVISEIDSLLISESEFLDALNKGFEEIKNYKK